VCGPDRSANTYGGMRKIVAALTVIAALFWLRGRWQAAIAAARGCNSQVALPSGCQPAGKSFGVCWLSRIRRIAPRQGGSILRNPAGVRGID
jgi:hypothetical protein